MKKIERIVLLVALMICATQVDAQKVLEGARREAVLSEIAAKNRDITSIEGEFKQRRETAMLKDAVETSGTFTYKKGGVIEWIYVIPQKKRVEISGDEIRVDGKSSGGRNRMTKGIMAAAGESLRSGMAVDERVFSATVKEGEKKYYVAMEPKRKDMQRMMKAIEVEYGKSDCRVKKITMTESDGNKTTIEFERLVVK